MNIESTRREFLCTAAAAVASSLPAATAAAAPPNKAIQVVVWDEQQPQQKEAYENFLGNHIARFLESRPGLTVKSVKLDDPEQGLSAETLGACDVLIWWGHLRNAEIAPETGRKIVARITDGGLSLIALHSAHWSTPFVEAMYERTRIDTERRFTGDGGKKVEVTFQPPPQRYVLPKADARLTPATVLRKFPDGRTKVTVHLPVCCFPAYRTDGKPSQLRVMKPEHPIVQNVPAQFELPHTEMYDEPFHVPEPDDLIFEERWATGEWFRSGMVWQVGKGRVFYFRPGHETFAVYKEKPVLQILQNAARWLGAVANT